MSLCMWFYFLTGRKTYNGAKGGGKPPGWGLALPCWFIIGLQK